MGRRITIAAIETYVEKIEYLLDAAGPSRERPSSLIAGHAAAG